MKDSDIELKLHDKQPANILESHHDFAERIVRHHAVTYPIKRKAKIDSKTTAQQSIAALEPENAVQMMLIAQMSSVHELQQKMMFYVNQTENTNSITNHVTSITKLSNLFIQQASLLQKLKGCNEQKIVFEHVHVHDGGQAVVGAIYTTPPSEDQKT